jgi:putative endonuclease
VSVDRRRLGTRGEALAASWYRAAGYEVLARNWRCREGEIDLVCRLGSTVVVCEVKTRRAGVFGPPAEAVTLEKRRPLRQLAAGWLRLQPVRYSTVRFDVASVVGGEVDVVTGAW